MKRDASKTEALEDKVRVAAGLPVGPDGAYFVGDTKDFGQTQTDSVTNFNGPPSGQPGLWCQWVPSADGEAIVWDEGEKFYEWEAWLEYIIEHFLKRWGYVLNGQVEWMGEDYDDRGRITVTDNVVKSQVATLSYN